MLKRETYIFWYHMTTKLTVMGENTSSDGNQSGESQSLLHNIVQVTKIARH